MDKLAYPLKEAAQAAAISLSQLRIEISKGEIVPRYVGRKPIVPASELQAWLDRLPTEPPGR